MSPSSHRISITTLTPRHVVGGYALAQLAINIEEWKKKRYLALKDLRIESRLLSSNQYVGERWKDWGE